MSTLVQQHPVTLNITVSDVNVQLTNGFDFIEIHRSTASAAGPFEEITGVGPPNTRIPLVTNQTL